MGRVLGAWSASRRLPLAGCAGSQVPPGARPPPPRRPRKPKSSIAYVPYEAYEGTLFMHLSARAPPYVCTLLKLYGNAFCAREAAKRALVGAAGNNVAVRASPSAPPSVPRPARTYLNGSETLFKLL